MNVAFDRVILCICVLPWITHVCGTPNSADTGLEEDKLDGSYLLTIGQTFNDPLLRLIGRTLIAKDRRIQQAFVQKEEEVEAIKDGLTEQLCKLHPCGEWSDWTECPVSTKQQFSMVTRNRECDKATPSCKPFGQNDFKSMERKVCEGPCPVEYANINGYFLKLSATKLSQPEAEESCQTDGGYLVNINTEKKSSAVHKLLSAHSYTGTIWINGNRTHIGASWVFTYGSSPDFDNWLKNEPSNGATELCKIEESHTTRKWCDRACSTIYKYVCEIPNCDSN